MMGKRDAEAGSTFGRREFLRRVANAGAGLVLGVAAVWNGERVAQAWQRSPGAASGGSVAGPLPSLPGA